MRSQFATKSSRDQGQFTRSTDHDHETDEIMKEMVILNSTFHLFSKNFVIINEGYGICNSKFDRLNTPTTLEAISPRPKPNHKKADRRAKASAITKP